MVAVLMEISQAVSRIIQTIFASDLDVMSDEVRKILSNPEDAKKYKEAIEDLKSGKEKKVTITLSDNKELTLLQ